MVRLSKEHGLNPSIDTCHICDKEMGIILFGSSYKDENGKSGEASMKICTGNICDDCKKVIEDGGVFFIEVRDGESGNNPYRTGRILALKEDAVKRVLNNYSKVNYIEHSVFERVFSSCIE